jgi:hypothetical protein
LPKDPLEFDLQDFKVEIAKAIFYAAGIVTRYIVPKMGNPKLHLWLAESDSEEVVTNVIQYCKENSFNLLVGNFLVSPDPSLWSQNGEMSFLHFNNSGYFFATNQGYEAPGFLRVFQSQFEVSYSPALVFSPQFKESIETLSREKPLVVLLEVMSPSPRLVELQWLMASQITLCSEEIGVASDV